MKKSELKQVLKPLIKECIKECIFEEGVLSGIITEVARGLGSQKIVAENRATQLKTNEREEQERQRQLEEEYEKQRQKKIRRLNESVKINGADSSMDIFEGTVPASSPDGSTPGALEGVSAQDPGIDISGIVNLSGKKWKHFL